MNQNWKKTMNNDEKQLQDWRLTKVEQDISEIKQLVIKMDKKLSMMPDGGLPCALHSMQLEAIHKHNADVDDKNDKRFAAVEAKNDGMNMKIVWGTAIAAVVLFLITQLIFPYVVSNFKVTPTVQTTSVISTNHIAIK